MSDFDIEIKNGAVDRHGFLRSHDESHIGSASKLAPIRHFKRLDDMGQIEGLDLGFDVMGEHLGGSPFDQIRRVLVDPRREVVGADRQRGHVGTQGQHRTSRLPCPGPTTGRALDDHAWAMDQNPLFQAQEFLGIG